MPDYTINDVMQQAQSNGSMLSSVNSKLDQLLALKAATPPVAPPASMTFAQAQAFAKSKGFTLDVKGSVITFSFNVGDRGDSVTVGFPHENTQPQTTHVSRGEDGSMHDGKPADRVSHPVPLLPLLLSAFICVICGLLSSCSSLELSAVAQLKSDQARFNGIRSEMRDAALSGRIAQSDWSSFDVMASVYIAAHYDAARALLAYHQAPNAEALRAARAALSELPGQLTAIEGFAKTALSRSQGAPEPGSNDDSNPQVSI